MLLILISILVFLELYLIKKIISFFLLSPIYIYLFFYTFSLILTVFYYYYYPVKINLYHFDNVNSETFLNTIFYYLLALLAFNMGVILYYDSVGKKSKLIFNKSFSDSLHIKIKKDEDNILIKIASIILAVTLLLYYLVYGKKIFYRYSYIPDVSKIGLTLIKILNFINTIILAFSYKTNKRKSLLLFLIIMFFSIGTGSRAVFLSLLAFFVIQFITNDNTLKNKLIFGLKIFFGLLFFAYIIQLRSLNRHGIIPHLAYLTKLDSSFIESFVFNIYYSFIFGVFVTIKTIQETVKDWNIILVSLNPLPGKWAGWYDYADKLRLNRYAPYSLHGQVFSMGKTFTFLFFFIVGLIFANIEKRVRKFILNGKKTLAFVIVLIMILFIVHAFEYHLRSAFRYIYYAYFIILITYFFSLLKPYLRIKKSYK